MSYLSNALMKITGLTKKYVHFFPSFYYFIFSFLTLTKLSRIVNNVLFYFKIKEN